MKGIIEIVKCSGKHIEGLGKFDYHNFYHAEDDYLLACKNAFLANAAEGEFGILLYKEKNNPENLIEYQSLASAGVSYFMKGIS